MTVDIMVKSTDFNSLRTNLLVGGLFFAGIMAGIALTTVMAPDSAMAMFVGFFVWPFSFGIGMSLWYGLASSRLAGKLVRALFKSLQTWDLDGSLRAELVGMDWKCSKSTRVFVPTTVLISFLASLIIASSPTARSFETVVCSFTGAGLAYSMFVTWLARLGILPLPRA